MTREEFMKDPKAFGFSFHPLDMDLAKMQFQMLQRMKDVKPHKLSPLVETFDSNYASRGFRETTLSIRECEHNEDGTLYMAEFAIANDRSIYVTSTPLYRGCWEDLVLFIDGKKCVGREPWDFFSLCKAYSLWFDWQLKNGVFEQMSDGLKGKARLIGWGNSKGADSAFVSITKSLLKGCHLIVRADVCVSYAQCNDIKNAAENYGVGLRFIEVHATSEFSVEASFEPIQNAEPRFLNVNRGRQMSARNAYVLATDFGRDFWMEIYREDAEGNRIRLWCGDFEIQFGDKFPNACLGRNKCSC